MLTTRSLLAKPFSLGCRALATSASSGIEMLRSIGIAAHVDSGKTTLTERILFYTGRIKSIHDVKGKDGVGAKMDSMELEREKGITIQSAATYGTWGDHHVNIIDTPGHVDFQIEVERALRVLDGAVLVLCGVSGVQSQSMTVDRQMRRYKVPRVAFINKLDRQGASPTKVIKDLKDKLGLNAVPLQLPIGLEDEHAGVVDVIRKVGILFKGSHGEELTEVPVPDDMVDAVDEARFNLIEALADVDEEIGELYLMDEEPSEEQIMDAVRRATISLDLCPVLMGSAFKNKGVQPLLDAVVSYLPNPSEVTNTALDRAKDEEEVELVTDDSKPLVALAFKLEESQYGQLTYMRLYQGSLNRGMVIHNIDRGTKMKVPRVVRMHSDEMEDIEGAGAGEILAMFGVECHSGDTFTDGSSQLAMTSMYCPDPVISYAVKPLKTQHFNNFSKALNRFTKEDPTFRTYVDNDSGETIISGMGELHLDIYVERMRREYKVELAVGEPKVNYRETVSSRGEFSYLHKKQSGGSGQYGRVVGYLEPLPEDHPTQFEFENAILGNAIPPEYINACRKGFEEALDKGALTGHPVTNVKVVLTDGQAHAVDSSEMAFRLAAIYAFRQGFNAAKPVILEPMMKVEVSAPTEFQGTIVALLNKRMGQLQNSETGDMRCTIEADVPLSTMFGFSTDLRSSTQGTGEYSMEYKQHMPVMGETSTKLMKAYQAERAQ